MKNIKKIEIDFKNKIVIVNDKYEIDMASGAVFYALNYSGIKKDYPQYIFEFKKDIVKNINKLLEA